jgi:hypothetical protein
VNDVTENYEKSFERLQLRYRNFAENEAKNVSPLYEELALTVIASEPLLHFIASLPLAKQQPNLVFAAVRHLYGTPVDGGHFVQLIEDHAESIRGVILNRSTQTNEPARCATLLPAFGLLPGPLALLEVGTSAGLCLLPDLWRYDYGRARLESDDSLNSRHPTPLFTCRANDATPIPDRMPTIAWRAGIDLNPIDLHNPEEGAWLETLVWPAQEERGAQLRAAIRVAQGYPLTLVKGDLLTDLSTVAATAPSDATLVIFHSAALFYVASAERDRFVAGVNELGAVWISNESPEVFPAIAEKLTEAPPKNKFLLSIDGTPVAATGPHGQSIDWFS